MRHCPQWHATTSRSLPDNSNTTAPHSQDPVINIIYAPFEKFGAVQKELENRNLEILSSGFDRIPQVTKKISLEQQQELEKLLEKIEQDEDVQNVYHSMG